MTFQTFRPADPLVTQFVDYYYLDSKPKNQETTYDCFPHYNNTLSLYASHEMPEVGKVIHNSKLPPLQIFTPLREDVLRVRQIGPVHRVVIVFKVLGPQQFWPGLSFAEYHTKHPFFNLAEMNSLFATKDVKLLTERLDQFLNKRYSLRPPDLVDDIVRYIFDHPTNFSVGEMASSFGVSRRHLHRLFKASIGVSIKRFQEIVVLRTCIDQKLSGHKEKSLTQLAYAANYSDQAHMIRAFRKFTERAPLQFFKKGQLLGQADTFWHLM